VGSISIEKYLETLPQIFSVITNLQISIHLLKKYIKVCLMRNEKHIE
jgi:hypothetical protein